MNYRRIELSLVFGILAPQIAVLFTGRILKIATSDYVLLSLIFAMAFYLFNLSLDLDTRPD